MRHRIAFPVIFWSIFGVCTFSYWPRANAQQSDFGTTKVNAVEVCKASGAQAYLAQLACSDGSASKSSRLGSVGERSPSRNNVIELGGGVQAAMDAQYKQLKPGEIDSHVVDAYQVTCGAKNVTIYVDMYHCKQSLPVVAPSGLFLKNREANAITAPRTNESADLTGSKLSPCPPSGRWDNCFGEVNSENGQKFVGSFKGGKASGTGTLTRADGSKYVGEFKNGVRDGRGNQTYPDGGNYFGEFKDDKLNGQGILLGPNGERYVGAFKDSKPHGRGAFYYPDGSGSTTVMLKD